MVEALGGQTFLRLNQSRIQADEITAVRYADGSGQLTVVGYGGAPGRTRTRMMRLDSAHVAALFAIFDE